MTADTLLEFFSLTHNPRLRRQLHEALSRLPQAGWTIESHQSPTWPDALLGLLRRRGGATIFRDAAAHAKGRPLTENDQLHNPGAGLRRLRTIIQKGILRPPDGHDLATFLDALVDAGQAESAALIAWSFLAGGEAGADAVLSYVKRSPALAPHFDFADCGRGDGHADKTKELRDLAAIVAGASRLEPQILERLGALAAELAAEARALATARAGRVTGLAPRIIELLPSALEDRVEGKLLALVEADLGRAETETGNLEFAVEKLQGIVAASHKALEAQELDTLAELLDEAKKVKQEKLRLEKLLRNLLGLLPRTVDQGVGVPQRQSVGDARPVSATGVDLTQEVSASRPQALTIPLASIEPKPSKAAVHHIEDASTSKTRDETVTSEGTTDQDSVQAALASPAAAVAPREMDDQRGTGQATTQDPSQVSAPRKQADDAEVVGRASPVRPSNGLHTVPPTGDSRGLEAFWRALAAEKVGLARALCEAGALGEDGALMERALDLASLALVTEGNGQFDDRAREVAERARDGWQTRGGRPAVALAAATLMLPASAVLALLAPGSNQGGLLATLLHPVTDQAHGRLLPALGNVARTMEEASAMGSQHLLPGNELLAALVSEEGWRAEVQRHCEVVRAWREAQSARRIRFAAATNAWQAMVRPDGVLGSQLVLVERNAASRLREIQERCRSFDFRVEFRRAERAVRGSSARTNPVEGPALREVEIAADEALELLRRWVVLQGRAPGTRTMERARPVAELRRRLSNNLTAAFEELAAATDPAVSAAGPIARETLARLWTLLQGGTPKGKASSPEALFGRDLLALPTVRLGRDWSRPDRFESAHLPDLIATAIESNPLDLSVAAGVRIATGDFIGAELAIAEIADDAVEAPLRRQLGEALGAAKLIAMNDIETVRCELEDAEREGRLDTGKAQELVEALAHAKAVIEHARSDDSEAAMADGAALCSTARAAVRAASEAVRRRIEMRLAALERPPSDGDHARVTSVLESGQFAIAEDLVERMEDGQPLGEDAPPHPVEERFTAFFPERADMLAAGLRQRTRGGRDEVGAVARAWARCAASRGNTLRLALLELFAAFGFTDPDLPGFAAPSPTTSECLFRLTVSPLRDRATAVLPEFGSSAGGSYSVLCLWQKRDAEHIAQALARHKVGTSKTIVLFFGILDSEQRRRLAGMARADRLPAAIVVDEVLALHLSDLSEAQLPTLFACTLPFSPTHPWADVGTPPPEMFFGRQRELRAVEAREGDFTHLLYGGRQLGKTALLRQAERAASGVPNSVALYVSIAAIGTAQPPADLWDLIATELSKVRVSIQLSSARNKPAVFASQVREWLERDPARRILLLLDEADSFFAADRQQGFAITEALRTLAVQTDRRFKPVFAGLRNVQKLAGDPNSPLAHLGTPIAVGPLIRGREREQAEALVRWPFAALGFRLDAPVVGRILTFANYYPSLIQVICQRLLRHLRQLQGGKGPPWRVRIDDVEAVLNAQELREAALYRFSITLQLDQRYNLIALVAAYYSMDDPPLLARGIDKSQLREHAALAWPAGFPVHFGDDAFEALLDEMVGLGLLRRVDGTHFALRSANLAHLIGNSQDISRQIDAFLGKRAPVEPDPLEHRRAVKDRPSLLTARQESEVISEHSGVIVLAGIDLARIADWRKSIRAAVDFARKRLAAIEVYVLRGPLSVARLKVEIASIASRQASGVRLVVISPELDWDADWVEAAQRALSGLSRDRLRVLFIANAARAWTWTSAVAKRQSLIRGAEGVKGVVELTAGPWSRATFDLLTMEERIRPWSAALIEVTGGWDRMIHLLSEPEADTPLSDAGLVAERLLARAESEADPLSDFRALPDALRVLNGLAEAEQLRRADERIDAALVAEAASCDREQVECGLQWAELVGVVSNGAKGLELNPLIRIALSSRLAAPSG